VALPGRSVGSAGALLCRVAVPPSLDCDLTPPLGDLPALAAADDHVGAGNFPRNSIDLSVLSARSYAYELISTDEHRATQYARAAHSAIIEAGFDPEIGEEAQGLMWMITDLI
jgi:hypothetical protein